MTSLEQLARQALEALEAIIVQVKYYEQSASLEALEDIIGQVKYYEQRTSVIVALRQALEQQANQEPVAYSYTSRITGRQTFSIHPQPPHLDSDSWDIKPLYTEPPHPPLNQFNPDWDTIAVMVEEQQRMAKRIEELEAATLQPTREWVGLSREELVAAYMSVGDKEWAIGGMQDATKFAHTIAAKLKERNT